MLFGLGKNLAPNQIDTVPVPGSVGSMGLMPCPGVRVAEGISGQKRHLQADLQEVEAWGANGVLCLVEPHELKMNKVETLPETIQSSGMWWMHLPIIDMDIPNQDFEDAWAVEGERIRHALRIGERVAIHCYAGLGRTGMIAARILVEFGVEPKQAIAAVRQSNWRRIQTRGQLNFVRSLQPLARAS